jgi:hypothetical protein
MIEIRHSLVTFISFSAALPVCKIYPAFDI